ncbi:major facilitator superfamily domain-containing protein [Plectosphaerella cucumerina]|uniref:Major facilitator superfamily domain-containing protein n=1 Tax=Plectosphaerella cucumerina TaxID=40658 RepID=A0A8K0T493_9PEZI|nr:major facilitator superfamily domain-containing protein [Plectosphaerella cucumerina]
MATQDDKRDSVAEHIDSLKAHPESGQQDGSHVEGNALLVNMAGEVRKIPVPSADPNDPLNFRRWEKYAVVFCCCWFSIMGLSMASGLGAILHVFFEMYIPQGYTPEDVVFLITMPTLCIGLGNFIILPLALAYGRRPVFLVSMVILLGATIAAAVQNSYDAHLAARIIQGLATGTSESLLPLMLTEVTFLHERGRIFGLYWMVQNCVSSTINLSSSYLNHDMGWRWYYWVFVITLGVGIILAFFFAFETQFTRPSASLDGQLVITDEFGVTRIVPDAEAQAYLEHMERSGMVAPGADNPASAVQRMSYKRRIRPWSTPHPQPVRVMLNSWKHMFQSFSSPGILYAVLTSSIVLGCGVGMSLTYNAVLIENYHWKQQDVGLINVGGVIGALLGMLYCTFLGDPFVLFLARRNKGVHKPEHQLITMAPPAVIGVGMLILYGFTADGTRGTTWWGPYLGWTVFQYAFTAVIITSTTFASEVAPKHPGPALVVVVGSKNIISFGVTYGLTPMIEKHGYEWAFNVLAGIMAGIFLLGVPVYIINPKWRAYVSAREDKKGVTTSD